MSAKIIEINKDKITIQIEIELNTSFLNTEENIQNSLNEAGSLTTQEALKRYDTDGSSIVMSGNKLTNKGLVKKMYQTP